MPVLLHRVMLRCVMLGPLAVHDYIQIVKYIVMLWFNV